MLVLCGRIIRKEEEKKEEKKEEKEKKQEKEDKEEEEKHARKQLDSAVSQPRKTKVQLEGQVRWLSG